MLDSLVFILPLIVESLLTAPGRLHELETVVVDGRLQRVYKNLWPSLRQFWLEAVARYTNDTYIVYESHRLSYIQVHLRAVKLAGLFRDVYNIGQGRFNVSHLPSISSSSI